MMIREEEKSDFRAAEEVTREAFWNHYVPGCDEHYLLHTMRESEAFIPALSMVAEQDGRIFGHIAYAKSVVLGDDGREHDVLTFGPVSVCPAFQGQGVGSALIEASLEKAAKMGFLAVIIYGNPAYYWRFGFLPAKTFGIATADDFWMPSLQGKELTAGALMRIGGGRFVEDRIYHVDDAAAEAYDRGFVPKQKQGGLPSQTYFQYRIGQRTPRHPK